MALATEEIESNPGLFYSASTPSSSSESNVFCCGQAAWPFFLSENEA